MNMECINTAGIDSLRGFSYQIKVFVLTLASIKSGEQVEYETIDDVNIQTINPSNFDDKCAGIINSIIDKKNRAIQVKRTAIGSENAKRILFNWLLLYARGDVLEYQLFTDSSYDNDDIIFEQDMNMLFDEIKQSRARSNALIAQVKAIYGSDKELFDTAIQTIKEKHKFVSINNIDNELINVFADIFVRDGVVDSIYELRIIELINFVIKGIFSSIEKREPFICDYLTFRKEAESICERIRNERIDIDYGCYTKANPVYIEDFTATREYIQLTHCNLSAKNIQTHLGYRQYYQQYRMMNLGNGRADLLDDIELTSVENFVMVKDLLQQEERDTPINRLNETKQMENSYSSSTQIKNGALVYLTKKDIEIERQISWKDEQDE